MLCCILIFVLSSLSASEQPFIDAYYGPWQKSIQFIDEHFPKSVKTVAPLLTTRVPAPSDEQQEIFHEVLTVLSNEELRQCGQSSFRQQSLLSKAVKKLAAFPPLFTTITSLANFIPRAVALTNDPLHELFLAGIKLKSNELLQIWLQRSNEERKKEYYSQEEDVPWEGSEDFTEKITPLSYLLMYNAPTEMIESLLRDPAVDRALLRKWASDEYYELFNKRNYSALEMLLRASIIHPDETCCEYDGIEVTYYGVACESNDRLMAYLLAYYGGENKCSKVSQEVWDNILSSCEVMCPMKPPFELEIESEKCTQWATPIDKIKATFGEKYKWLIPAISQLSVSPCEGEVAIVDKIVEMGCSKDDWSDIKESMDGRLYEQRYRNIFFELSKYPSALPLVFELINRKTNANYPQDEPVGLLFEVGVKHPHVLKAWLRYLQPDKKRHYFFNRNLAFQVSRFDNNKHRTPEPSPFDDLVSGKVPKDVIVDLLLDGAISPHDGEKWLKSAQETAIKAQYGPMLEAIQKFKSMTEN